MGTQQLYGKQAELCSQASAKWWIDRRDQSQAQVMGGRNPIAILGMVLDGSTPKQTALSLWTDWIAQQPEIIEFRKKVEQIVEKKED